MTLTKKPLKTLWQKEKMQVTSNLSFPQNVFKHPKNKYQFILIFGNEFKQFWRTVKYHMACTFGHCVSVVSDQRAQSSWANLKRHFQFYVFIPLQFFQGYAGISLSVCPSVYKILISIKWLSGVLALYLISQF